MMDSTNDNAKQLDTAIRAIQFLKQRLQTVIVGQENVIDYVLTAFLSGGHVLLEGVPGVGKTLLVKTLAHNISGAFNRIQFTPDLMPSDVTGHYWMDNKQQQFVLREGPVFTNLLLTDEINRAPAKTQAALLEVMQEYSVTLDGTTHEVPKPFMVLATQNPIEQEGTYPLPEAQLDRFMFKVLIDYPTMNEEIKLLSRLMHSSRVDTLPENENNLTIGQMLQLQKMVEKVTISSQIVEYVAQLVGATRHNNQFSIGAGPRAGIALLQGARSYALLQGMDFVTPDHIKALWLPTMRHRVRLSIALEMEGFDLDTVLTDLTHSIAAPRT